MGAKSRRTTLTLPADTLGRAERIAKSRKVTLSAVVSEALDNALSNQNAEERRRAILQGYQRAFAGFTPDEMAILDGILLQPVRKRSKG